MLGCLAVGLSLAVARQLSSGVSNRFDTDLHARAAGAKDCMHLSGCCYRVALSFVGSVLPAWHLSKGFAHEGGPPLLPPSKMVCTHNLVVARYYGQGVTGVLRRSRALQQRRFCCAADAASASTAASPTSSKDEEDRRFTLGHYYGSTRPVTGVQQLDHAKRRRDRVVAEIVEVRSQVPMNHTR